MLLLLAATTPAGRVAAADRGTLTIGLLDPSSGPRTWEGADVQAGFRYFLATHEDRLGGFRVDIRSADEGTSVDDALRGAHDLIERQNVDVVVGLDNSADASGVASYVAQQQRPLIVTVAGADALTQQQATPMLFRVSATNSQASMPLGDYTCRALHLRTASVIGVDYSYGWEAVGGFARAYRDAGCRIIQEAYAPSAASTEWPAVVSRIDRHADVVFAAMTANDAVPFMTAYRAARMNVPLVGLGPLTDNTLLPQEGSDANGVLTAYQYDAYMPGAANAAFRLGYQSLNGRAVSLFAEDGYVAAAVLASALQRLPASPLSTQQLVAALRTVHVDVPRGSVHFDSRGQIVEDIQLRVVSLAGGKHRNVTFNVFPMVNQFWRYDPAKYLDEPTYEQRKGTWVSK